MALHLRKTDDGFELVQSDSGPYSNSEPTVTPVYTLTAEDVQNIKADLAALEFAPPAATAVSPSTTEPVPVPAQMGTPSAEPAKTE
jgi:hypothetical protein